MPPSERHADTGYPLPLVPSTAFVHCVHPFSFRLPTASPWQRSSRAFQRVVWSVEDTCVGDTPLRDRVKARLHDAACWTPHVATGGEYILSHIKDFVFGAAQGDDAPPERPGYTAAFNLNRDALQALLPGDARDGQFVLSEEKAHVRYGLRVASVRLFLFRSQVGLLVLTVEPDDEVVETSAPPFAPLDADVLLPDAALRARGLRLDREALCRPIDPAEQTTRPFHLGDLVRLTYRISRLPGHHAAARLYACRRQPRDRLFRPEAPGFDALPSFVDFAYPLDVSATLAALLDGSLPRDEHPGAAAWTPFHPRRMLSYAFGLVDAEAMGGTCSYDAVRLPLYHLRRSFNHRYDPPAEQLRSKDNPEVLATFDNVVYGFSTEGGAALAWDRPANRSFIRQQLPVRIRRSYTLLYLLALHQRYACIHFAKRIGRLPFGPSAERTRSALQEARALRERIFAFTVRAWFHEVSDRRIYTDVYHRWQEVLGTRPLFEEVTSQVGELDDYLRRVQSDRASQFAGLVSWLIVPLVLFLGVLSTNFVELQDVSLADARVWAWGGLATAVYLVVAWQVRRLFR